jgi:uncharacterized membrane-anchored protein YitT (DUF2179 family)
MKNWKDYLAQLLGIVIGVIVLAATYNMFLIPNKIAAGGISGLGVILFHLFGVPVGLTVLLANVPLFFLAWIFFGWKFVANALVGSLLFPVMLEFFSFLPLITGDLLLASIFGGIGTGFGLGVVFRSRGSTGGTALAAQLINHFLGVTTGQALIGADLLIVIAAGFLFNVEVALFALLSIFVSSKFIDFVQEGFNFSKAAIIITDKKEEIATKIMDDLGRGVTLLEGRGAYTGAEKGIVFCIVSQLQISRLKDVVRAIDPSAFVIVSNVAEVLGEGFQVI